MKANNGYGSLAGVLQRALDQAQNGKGAERHANELPFDQQPMQVIAGQVGVGFLTGQAIKKAHESAGLEAGRDVAELLGAINYLAGAVIFLESKRDTVARSGCVVLPEGFIPYNRVTDRIPRIRISAVCLGNGVILDAHEVDSFHWDEILGDSEREIVGYKPHG